MDHYFCLGFSASAFNDIRGYFDSPVDLFYRDASHVSGESASGVRHLAVDWSLVLQPVRLAYAVLRCPILDTQFSTE